MAPTVPHQLVLWPKKYTHVTTSLYLLPQPLPYVSAVCLRWSWMLPVAPFCGHFQRSSYSSPSTSSRQCKWKLHWSAYVPALAPCLPSPPTKCRLRLGLAVAAVNHNFPKIAPEPKQLLQRGMTERGVTLSPKGHYTRRNDLGAAIPFFFWRLLAVRTLSCMRIQACILHLFSAFAFQMSSCWNFRWEPPNCILDAERVK